jgi:hypothetical protein
MVAKFVRLESAEIGEGDGCVGDEVAVVVRFVGRDGIEPLMAGRFVL